MDIVCTTIRYGTPGGVEGMGGRLYMGELLGRVSGAGGVEGMGRAGVHMGELGVGIGVRRFRGGRGCEH